MRDRVAALADAGVQVVAVSPDGQEVTERFCEAYGLDQITLVDPDKAVAAAFGVSRVGGWLPNRRMTYRIAQDGTIAAAFHGEFGLEGHLAVAK